MKWLALAALAVLVGSHSTAQTAAIDEAEVARGGRLYDNWSRESRDRPPRGPHPAFTKRADVLASDTWRCTECHGWDYKGSSGIAGIRGRQGGDPASIVAVLKDATHRYGGLMRESDLRDLASFVSHGQTDMQGVIEAARRVQSAASSYQKFFGTICASCHGLDGGRLGEVQPLGDVARQRPIEVVHVVLNGHPGGDMPALRALGPDFTAGMLAYLQTLPTLNLPASIAHGGRLYDDWQVEAGARRQSLPHPGYPRTAFYANDAALTWRCKACHGWDYQGSQGNYARGRHFTGIKGIRGMAGANPARIVAILRDSTHLYDAVLKERDLQDLANFVSAGQVDMDAAIDRQTHRARGDAGRATAYYRTICSVCHGLEGHRIVTAAPLGSVARVNPWETLHKIVNGHPNERMPALREFELRMLIDILAYVQELPETR